MRRQRLAPVLVAAGIGGALLVPGVALARTSTVTFHGGCGLLGVGASSRPDEGGVTVPSGSTVTFVNHLGRPAKLTINGVDRGAVPTDQQVSVLFRQGRLSVAMVPGCALGGGGPESVTVTVTPASGAPGASAPVAASPSGRSSGAGRSPEVRTTAHADPSASAEAAMDPAAPLPDDALPSPNPAAVTDPALDSVAVGTAEPGPASHRGASSLLVFLAGICVVGVSIAATRAILAQRAIRTVAA